MSECYYIWSFEHRAWWKADSWGYTRTLSQAGRYSLEQAAEIVACANHCLPLDQANEALVPVGEVKEFMEAFQFESTQSIHSYEPHHHPRYPFQ